MTRSSATVLAGRNARARELGWRSYSQRRYWEGRWSRETAEKLAEKVCDGHKEGARAGSIMCAECNMIVNPMSGSRSGDWRARLVRVYLERRGRRGSSVGDVDLKKGEST